MLDAITGKSSLHDFISTTLLKDCSVVFAIASVIARLMNLSFTEGSFLIQFKTAQVIPIVKKAGLDNSNLVSYRTNSNPNTKGRFWRDCSCRSWFLTFRLQICPLHTAYHQFHSTETALFRIARDLFEAAESGCYTVLVDLKLLTTLRYHRLPGTCEEAWAHIWRPGTGPRLGKVLSRGTLMLCQGW